MIKLVIFCIVCILGLFVPIYSTTANHPSRLKGTKRGTEIINGMSIVELRESITNLSYTVGERGNAW